MTYRVPGPYGDSTLRQTLYPYAVNGPASYMAPGQKFWGSESTQGGWYRGTATLKAMLVKAGLPATAPTKRAGRGQAHKRAVAVGAGAGIALAAGALGLAAVNVATLALAGRPWGVTGAFALWGSKAIEAAGVNVASWPYWSTPARSAELHASVFKDITSVMDFGIILGALAAAGIAGRFAPAWRVPAYLCIRG